MMKLLIIPLKQLVVFILSRFCSFQFRILFRVGSAQNQLLQMRNKSGEKLICLSMMQQRMSVVTDYFMGMFLLSAPH